MVVVVVVVMVVTDPAVGKGGSQPNSLTQLLNTSPIPILLYTVVLVTGERVACPFLCIISVTAKEENT
ncbi:hypothetical protein E2C01_027791 [Portunus trituberculatus]|uniref:Uncharacterized protein n=1 Tax=Portunus trituberculatus TaxID=210409 RepID=A0A5B7EPT6_PORTR|nr:hypothetical protein [Portunus trituberculatus]